MRTAPSKLLRTLMALTLCVAAHGTQVSAANEIEPAAPSTRETLSGVRDELVRALKSSGKERVEGLQRSYKLLEQASDHDPSLPPARTMWAKILFSAGDVKSGRTTLQQSVTENPDDPEAYVLIGSLAAQEGRIVEASLAFAQAEHLIATHENLRDRKNGMLSQLVTGQASIAQAKANQARQNGNVELAASQLEIARSQLRRWVELSPNNASAHDQLGAALFRNGETDLAIQSFDRARELNPALPLTDLRLAQVYLMSGEREKALTHVTQAVETHRDDANVHAAAADLMLVMDEDSLAELHIQRSLGLDPNNLSAKRLDAQLMRYRGQWKAAADALQRLNTDNPTDFETANLLALTLSELDDTESRKRALSVATVTAQRFDANSRLGRRSRIALIWTAFVNGQVDAAQKALDQLLNNGIRSNEISGDEGYYLSRLLAELGRPEVAVKLLSSTATRIGTFPKRSDAEALLAQLN